MGRSTLVVLLLVLSLLLTACGAAGAGVPSPSGDATATTTSAAPGAAATRPGAAAESGTETSGGGLGALGEKRSEGAAVTIVATWSSADPPSLKLAMDTHSVDLDTVDPSAATRLRLNGGEWIAPTRADAPKGGHHRAASLTFGSVPSAAFASARLIEVRVTDVGVPERILRWERAG